MTERSEVLWQHRQPRASFGGLGEQLASSLQIAGDIRLADHLDDCDRHDALHGRRLS